MSQEQERIYKVLLAPLNTEKSELALEEGGQSRIAFKVATCANKFEIQEAVEKLFKVEVAKVMTLNVKGKVKREMSGKTSKRVRYAKGKLNDWKKAYVVLKPGQIIESLAAQDKQDK